MNRKRQWCNTHKLKLQVHRQQVIDFRKVIEQLIDKMNTMQIFIKMRKYFLFIFIDFREQEERKKRNIKLLSHLFMHSLVDSCIYPDRGLNLQPWHIGMMFKPTTTWPGPKMRKYLKTRAYTDHFLINWFDTCIVFFKID